MRGPQDRPLESPVRTHPPGGRFVRRPMFVKRRKHSLRTQSLPGRMPVFRPLKRHGVLPETWDGFESSIECSQRSRRRVKTEQSAGWGAQRVVPRRVGCSWASKRTRRSYPQNSRCTKPRATVDWPCCAAMAGSECWKGQGRYWRWRQSSMLRLPNALG